MKFIDTVFEKLRRHPKRIVFTDGPEPRVLHAAAAFVKEKLGIPVILGKRATIEEVARVEKVDLDHVAIIDPETSSDLPLFCQRLEKLERYQRMGVSDSRSIMLNPNYFGSMMVQYGQADALLGGAGTYSSSILRPIFQLIKPLPGQKLISSCMILELADKRWGHNGVFFVGDCAVIPEPNVEQLAMIAVQTGRTFRQLTGDTPRVALLSFSTKGSATTPATQKVAAATALARQMAEEQKLPMEIDGEMQADTALLPELASRKAISSFVAGRANVLIFPDLNSGNIGAKLIQYLAGAEAYGQILLGISKPAAEISRGAEVETILGVAAITGLQAIEYRRLYPEAQIIDSSPA